jgi:hypothetical protein
VKRILRALAAALTSAVITLGGSWALVSRAQYERLAGQAQSCPQVTYRVWLGIPLDFKCPQSPLAQATAVAR